MGAILFFLTRRIGYDPTYMLILKYRQGNFENIEPELKKYFHKYFIRSDTRKEETVEKVIEVKVDEKIQNEALKKVREAPGVESCALLASNGEFSE